MFENFFKDKISKTRLFVMDFDGTLACVPTKPVGDKRAWDGKDWWGSKCSLLPKSDGGFYEGNVNQMVIDAFNEAKDDPHTISILITGRRSKVATYVRKILRKNNLFGQRIIGNKHEKAKFHFLNDIALGKDQIHPKENKLNAHYEFYMNDFTLEDDYPKTKVKKGLKPSHNTIDYKIYIINKFINQNDGFDLVEIWEDNKENITRIKDFLSQNDKIKKTIIHYVESDLGKIPLPTK